MRKCAHRKHVTCAIDIEAVGGFFNALEVGFGSIAEKI